MAAGLIHSLILASSLVSGVHPGHDRPASPAVAHPVEPGRPRQSAHVGRPRALEQSDWYLLVRPQHVRLHPAVVPAQRRVLEPGLLLHSARGRVGPWVRVYDPRGRSWVLSGNVRPAPEPAWYRRLERASTLQRRPPVTRPGPRVSPPPLPLANAAPVASAGAAAAATTVPAPVTVVQVVVPQAVQPPPSVEDQILATGDSAWGVGQGQYLAQVVGYESSFDPYAVNPSSGACGLFQRLPCDVPLGDVGAQTQDGIAYISQRYGTASVAWQHELSFGWY